MAGRANESTRLHVGWHELVDDVSMNFQLNRWAAYGGPRWLQDVVPVVRDLSSFDTWRDGFVTLGERAAAEGRELDAALHLRCAEFFMVADDPRKAPTRARLLAHLATVWPLEGDERLQVVFDGVPLPVVHLKCPSPRDVLVVFGGFDSYIEEFLPLLLELRDRGFEVVAFEGPGQGAVLEDHHLPMSPNWHRPVGAVLDALGLDGVTLVGVSLGGCLAIRAAAHEPRVHRVVAFDVLTNFWECLLRQVPRGARGVVEALMTTHAKPLVDLLVEQASQHRPVVEWGVGQAMRVFGAPTPYDAWQAASRFRTDDVSGSVRQDVLLLAGAEDHYVPVEQLHAQMRSLVAARSISARVFTRQESAHAHCQVGNLPLAIDTLVSWLETLQRRLAPPPQGDSDERGRC